MINPPSLKQLTGFEVYTGQDDNVNDMDLIEQQITGIFLEMALPGKFQDIKETVGEYAGV